MNKISPDQVSWMKDAIWRYGETMKIANSFPRVSQLRKAAESACVVEIMEILRLQFENNDARLNAFSGLLLKTAAECVNVAARQSKSDSTDEK